MTHKDSPAITQRVVLEAQWSDIPDDVYEEVVQLWRDRELGNDYYYVEWDEEDFLNSEDASEDDDYKYPKLAAYLRSAGIDSCLIHWWW